jgi:hypothetical protein
MSTVTISRLVTLPPSTVQRRVRGRWLVGVLSGVPVSALPLVLGSGRDNGGVVLGVRAHHSNLPIPRM